MEGSVNPHPALGSLLLGLTLVLYPLFPPLPFQVTQNSHPLAASLGCDANFYNPQ